jgi:hypothetical protein
MQERTRPTLLDIGHNHPKPLGPLPPCILPFLSGNDHLDTRQARRHRAEASYAYCISGGHITTSSTDIRREAG